MSVMVFVVIGLFIISWSLNWWLMCEDWLHRRETVSLSDACFLAALATVPTVGIIIYVSGFIARKLPKDFVVMRRKDNSNG